jgi:large subunit ribosomal protein L15
MPIQRRLPKRGFTNISKKQYSVVNIRDLSRFDGSEVVDQTVLVRAGLVQGRHDGIKLLGQGTLDRPLTVRVHKVSKSALEKVLQAGGKVETA